MKKSLIATALIGGLAVTSLGAPHADAASPVSLAKQGVGAAYTWGDNDCSGFTMRIFSRLGIQLPHSSAAQAGYGVPVSRSDLRPGDLVFFNTSGSGISHVGIYVGGGRMISAESEKTGVRETQIFGGGAASYWEPRYVTARRLTSGSQTPARQAADSAVSDKAQAAESSAAQQAAKKSSAAGIQSSVAANSAKQAAANQSPSASVAQNKTATAAASAKQPAAAPTRSQPATGSQKTAAAGSGRVQANSGVYIIQAGDTLWEIANDNGITVREIRQANKLDGSLIHPGQKIYLYGPNGQYTIQSGDSLWAIARKNGTTVAQLMKLNHLSSDRIYPDQKLTISRDK